MVKYHFLYLFYLEVFIMTITFEATKQLCLFIIVFSISFGLGLCVFYVLKDKFISKFGSDELKEANKKLNKMIDQAPQKLKNMVKKNG